jgi:hypothetical protein
MADKKISQLATASTPLAGSEVLPIVQSGSTVKATVVNLFTGRVLDAALGAVGAPSYAFTGDPNTGMWSPAADTLAISTNGAERMRFDSSGNAGLGTTTPVSGGFTVGNDGNGSATVKYSLSTSNTERASIQLNGASAEMRLTAGYAGYGGLLTIHANGSERMRVTSDGNIVAGASVALATTATNGFLYVPTCAGTPTGVPTAITGMAPLVVNTTNNKLYFYSGGAWRDAGP